MYKKTLIKITTFVALISAIMINGCSHTSTPVKKPTIPEVTLPSVYDEYETETNSEGEIVVIVPSTDENGSTEYITEIATDEAGENITIPPTTEAPTEPETKPAPENQTTEPVTEPSGEDMTEAPTQKPTTKPTEPTTSKKEDDTTKPTSKPTNAPTTEPQTTKPTQPPTTEPETTKPVVPPTTEPQTTVPPTTEAPTPTPTEPPTTAPVIKDRVIKTTDADYVKYNERVAYWIKWNYTVYTTGEWVYVIKDDAIYLIQYVGTAKTVTVPTSIHNKPVTVLEDVFKNNATVENVIIPANNSITRFLNVFDNANIKTVKIGHQAALTNTQAGTFDFANGISYTPDKTVYVYLDEDFVAKAWKNGNGTINADCNCTFVVSMNDGRTAYYHGYYNECDHEYHLYE